MFGRNFGNGGKGMGAVKKSVEMWCCDKCGKVWNGELAAEICCKEYWCEKCGEKTEQFKLICEKCAMEKDFEEGERIDIEDYDLDVYWWDGEYKYGLDCLEDREWVYGVDEFETSIDWRSVLDSVVDDVGFECFEDKAYDEMKEFCEKWSEKWKRKYYVVNYGKIVVLKNI